MSWQWICGDPIGVFPEGHKKYSGGGKDTINYNNANVVDFEVVVLNKVQVLFPQCKLNDFEHSYFD